MKAVKNRVSLVLALTFALWTLALPTWAQATGLKELQCLRFRGQDFKPTPQQLEGKTVFMLDDPEIVRLLAMTSSQLQWSSTGQTLYVFTPGQESYWTNRSDKVSLKGQDIPAPGLLFTQPNAMEPAALFFALRLTPATAEGATLLLPSVTAIDTDETGNLVLRVSAPIKPTVADNNNVLVLDLGQAAWSAGERTVTRGEMTMVAQGGEKGAPLMLTLTYPKNWGGRLKPTLNGELVVVTEPRYPCGKHTAPGALKKVAAKPSEGGSTVVFEFDRPCQFHWSLNPQTHLLTVEIPQFSPAEGVALDGMTLLKADAYPVLRYVTKVDSTQAFEFFEYQELPYSIALRVGPAASMTALQNEGTAITSGFTASAKGTIVLDAGHGGSDPGCCNRALGVYEKDVTLDIVRRLRDVLTAQGWTVVLTRDCDRDVTYAGSPDKMELQARADVANNCKADLFISIHCNASVSNAHRGTSIHWYKPEDYELAQSLEHVLSGNCGFDHKGLIRNRFMVLRCANMPSVLVETAYLTNPTEGALLASPQLRQAVAERLAGGLGSYMEGRFASRGNARAAEVMR